MELLILILIYDCQVGYRLWYNTENSLNSCVLCHITYSESRLHSKLKLTNIFPTTAGTGPHFTHSSTNMYDMSVKL